MSDIFTEVDEEIRREQLRRLWERHAVAIISVALLIIVAVGGWRGYEWYQAGRSAKDGSTFQQAMTLSADGKHDEAEAIFQQLSREGSSAYHDIARIQAATELAQKDAAGAVTALKAIAADSATHAVMKDVALLRAGFVMIDTASYEDMRKTIEPLTAAGRPFSNSARELLALSAWRTGNKAEAKTWLDQIQNDPTASSGLRNRIQVMQALLAADGVS